MNAQLQDGSLITLERDCACLTHEGPHWLYMDAMSQWFLDRDYRQPIEAIIKLGAAATPTQVRHAEVLFVHYCQRQAERLGELRRNLETRGIARLIR